MDQKEEFMDKLEAASYTTTENMISLLIIAVTLFFHVVFTMAFHLI